MFTLEGDCWRELTHCPFPPLVSPPHTIQKSPAPAHGGHHNDTSALLADGDHNDEEAEKVSYVDVEAD